jgi:hypothetical protein
MYIIAAPSLRYKAIIGVIDAAKGAGVDRVGTSPKGCAAPPAADLLELFPSSPAIQ